MPIGSLRSELDPLLQCAVIAVESGGTKDQVSSIPEASPSPSCAFGEDGWDLPVNPCSQTFLDWQVEVSCPFTLHKNAQAPTFTEHEQLWVCRSSPSHRSFSPVRAMLCALVTLESPWPQ